MLDDDGQAFCARREGTTHSEVDFYFAIFISPLWIGGYIYFWDEVRGPGRSIVSALVLRPSWRIGSRPEACRAVLFSRPSWRIASCPGARPTINSPHVLSVVCAGCPVQGGLRPSNVPPLEDVGEEQPPPQVAPPPDGARTGAHAAAAGGG